MYFFVNGSTSVKVPRIASVITQDKTKTMKVHKKPIFSSCA